VPGAAAGSSRGGEPLAVSVGAREASQVRAVADASAGNEECHWGRWLLLLLSEQDHGADRK
jgi:hypothetical protein